MVKACDVRGSEMVGHNNTEDKLMEEERENIKCTIKALLRIININ